MSCGRGSAAPAGSSPPVHSRPAQTADTDRKGPGIRAAFSLIVELTLSEREDQSLLRWQSESEMSIPRMCPFAHLLNQSLVLFHCVLQTLHRVALSTHRVHVKTRTVSQWTTPTQPSRPGATPISCNCVKRVPYLVCVEEALGAAEAGAVLTPELEGQGVGPALDVGGALALRLEKLHQRVVLDGLRLDRHLADRARVTRQDTQVRIADAAPRYTSVVWTTAVVCVRGLMVIRHDQIQKGDMSME